jgi:Acetoacetate decarboxylase (ADC)
MFKPEPGRRYDMPPVFGPSEIGGQARYGEIRMIAHSFLTEPAALEPLIPYHFSLAQPAKVTFIGRMHTDVDWLAGRPYQSVRVSADVEARDGDAVLRGPYGLVVWESDARPVIAGREYLGISKIIGELPEHERGTSTAAFECFEYGTRLLRVEVRDITPAGADEVARLNSRGEAVTFGWKYIPGPGGTVDADYPVKMVSRPSVTAAWHGVSTLSFGQPTWEQCPISYRIAETLAALPVVEVLPATLTVSNGSRLDREASARIGQGACPVA